LGLPNERIGNFHREERRAGVSSAVMSAWAQTPLYSARWQYLHRPSVWASMATQNRGFRWQGLTGFKTLFAGGTGIGYGGQQRERYSRMIPTGWAIRAGGGIIKHTGKAIQRIPTTYRSAGRVAIGFGGGTTNLGWGGTYGSPMGWTGRLGRGMETFGGGMRKGGIGGGLAALGGTAGRWGEDIQKAFGGGYYSRIGGYGALQYRYSTDFLSNVYGQYNSLSGSMTVSNPAKFADLPVPGMHAFKDVVEANELYMRDVIKKSRISGLWNPAGELRRLRRGMLSEGASMEHLTLSRIVENQTGTLSRAVRSVAGAKLMVGVTTGVNIALIGGLLAEGAYRGVTKATEYAMKFQEWGSARRLEFGTGVNPFMSSGALTERQRALTAISSSRLNARSAIGQEAQLAHDYAM
jgi:hypothetical protein